MDSPGRAGVEEGAFRLTKIGDAFSRIMEWILVRDGLV